MLDIFTIIKQTTRKAGEQLADYQMERAIGKYFRAKSDRYVDSIRIFGMPFTYKVIEGIPEVGTMLEVVSYDSQFLHVRVNNELFENGGDYIVNH